MKRIDVVEHRLPTLLQLDCSSPCGVSDSRLCAGVPYLSVYALSGEQLPIKYVFSPIAPRACPGSKDTELVAEHGARLIGMQPQLSRA